MKSFMKKAVAVMLTLALVAGMSVCFAAEKEYEDYGTYVLLGDSVASGYNDLEYVDSEFKRVENSYADFVADDLGVELIPLACPGFRTIELRYIMEDDFTGIDDYLFHASHTPNEEIIAMIPQMRKAISEAGLITLGVGGNDFGAYIGWVVSDIMDEDGLFTEFVEKARALLEEKGIANDTLDSFLDLADTMGVLPNVVAALPEALDYGIGSLFNNWNPMIEDIYRLNPDVTLMVVGMFDTGVKTEEDAEKNEKALIKLNIAQAIVDFANGPMIEGAEKYGYTFVDVTGTTCDETHPNVAGHRFIADKILEALPDANFPYEDVKHGTSCYKAVEYMHKNGIMEGTSHKTFSPNGAFTKSQLAQALYNIEGKPEVNAEGVTINDVDPSDPAKTAIVWALDSGIFSLDINGNFSPDNQLTETRLAIVLFHAAIDGEFNLGRWIKAMSFAFRIIISNPGSTVTRGEAAVMLLDFIEL